MYSFAFRINGSSTSEERIALPPNNIAHSVAAQQQFAALFQHPIVDFSCSSSSNSRAKPGIYNRYRTRTVHINTFHTYSFLARNRCLGRSTKYRVPSPTQLVSVLELWN